MRRYLDYIEDSFFSRAGWDAEDSYAQLTLNARNVLDFELPATTSVTVSSRTTPHAFVSHELASLAPLAGSIAYLYSSLGVIAPPSKSVPLAALTASFRPEFRANRSGAAASAASAALLFGRMRFPGQQLEAMYVQTRGRLAGVAKWVVDPRLETPVVLTATAMAKSARWTRELIYSTHEHLVGWRMLATVNAWCEEGSESRLVAGMEAFYAAGKKSPGMSVGLKYQKQAKGERATPLTLTLVSNPLMGSVSVAYALQATPQLALATRFDYNVYSYLSDLSVGGELWRLQPISLRAEGATARAGPTSVLKASVSLAQQTVRVAWVGAVRDCVVEAGVHLGLAPAHAPPAVGLALTYSA